MGMEYFLEDWDWKEKTGKRDLAILSMTEWKHVKDN